MLGVAGLATPTLGQTVGMVAPASECPQPDPDRWCAQTRVGLAEDIAKAWTGDYQSQRNIAYCLMTGCRGALRPDRLLACAWRIVIVQSGAAEVDRSDTDNLDGECGKRLSRTEKQAAAAKAGTMFRRLYGRPPPAFDW